MATLALIVLSVVSMLSYRNALLTLTARARAEVLVDVRAAAGILPLDATTSGALRRALGRESNASLIRADGSIAAAIGSRPEGDPFAPLEQAPSEPLTAGPNPATGNRVVAWLPLRNGLTLRIDRARPSLANEWQRWTRLMIVVTLAVGALGTLLLLYLRRLFAPIDDLLRSARELGEEGPQDGDDEIEFLVHRFERAMAVLREQRSEGTTSPEQLLGQHLETLEQTFSSLESGMMLLDLEGAVLALNEVGAKTLALDASVLPAPLREFLAQHSDMFAMLETALCEGTSLRRQECPVAVQGQARTLGMTLSPLSRRDGTRRGWIVLFADLTDAQQLAENERLSTSLNQLAELSAGLAHELRNSLASMQGYAALLKRAPLPTAAAADTLELQREIDQLHRIVEDFLSFARPGTSQLENIDLLRLAHRAAGDPALGGAPVKVETTSTPGNVDSNRWTVNGDEQMLHRLLRNLLLNAVRAQAEQSDDPVPVVVRLGKEPGAGDSSISVHIEDQGPGLSPAAERTLFVPFATTSKGGTGLGLAVARRIADLHGAQLTVTNRQERGVRATLTFAGPVTQAPKA